MYHNFRYSEYRHLQKDLSSKEDFEKRAFKYFGKQIGKFSGTNRIYDKGDIEGSWIKYELGYEEPVRMKYDVKAIGFEEHQT